MPSTDITVMTYNVGQWYTGSGQLMPDSAYPTYSALHRSIFAAYRPDIVVFQEYMDPVITGHPADDLLGDYFDNHVVGLSRPPYFTKTIYTNGLPLENTVSRWFQVNGSPGDGWNYMMSEVNIDGVTVHIINVHWENVKENRIAHAKEIFDIVSQYEYFILMGDLNVTCMSVEDWDYPNVIQQYVDAGYNMANHSEKSGFFKTWFAGHNFDSVDYESRSSPCDNIITSPNITINEVIRDEHKIAVCEEMQTRIDHVPLIAKLTVHSSNESSVYNKSGRKITAVFNKAGRLLSQAYDLLGKPLMSSEDGVPLTVMQYNVGQWYTGSGSRMPDSAYPTYSALHRSIIEDYAPDIVTFNEYCDPVITGHSVDELIGEFFTDHATGGEQLFPYFWKAFYTNGLELGETTFHYFAANGETGNKWSYIRSSVEILGHTVHLFNVHWENDAAYRASHAKEIFDIVSQLDYFIVMGDLNTTCMSVEDSDYPAVMKQFVDAGYHCANCSPEFGFFKTWFAGHNFDTVDYESRGAPNDGIITSPNIVINEVIRDEHKIPVCEAMQTRLDHAPLIAKVTVH